MSRKCYDIGVIFYCIFVTIMEIFGRPISMDFLEKGVVDKNAFNKITKSDRNGIPEGRKTGLTDVSPDSFPFYPASSHGRNLRTGLSGNGNKYRPFMNNSVTNTPEYMLELYNKLSKRKPFLHNSNIIRSFLNLPQHGMKTNTSGSGEARVHSLIFNISTLDNMERINLAELRLYTLIKRDQSSFIGVRRYVSVYEVIELVHNQRTREKYNYITSKYILSLENAWESFDVTSALKRSVKHGSKIERLAVRIRSLYTPHPIDTLDFNANQNDPKQPILVVYSNDKSVRHEHSADRHELMMHNLLTEPDTGFKYSTPLSDYSSSVYTESQHHGNHERVKRSRLRNTICRRRPMYVDFADIGIDWIIAPRGYQAYQCAGRCYFPLSDQMHPTKHAIIQLLMHKTYPRRATKICCVPTKLEPISILYMDNYGVVTYKYSYDGMVVSQCGCR